MTAELVQQPIEVSQIVLKPVPTRSPGAFPVATPIWRDHVPVLIKGVDQELKDGGGIPAAMEKHDRRGVTIAPASHMKTKPAHLNKGTLRQAPRCLRRSSVWRCNQYIASTSQSSFTGSPAQAQHSSFIPA
jgi:hypothetical protein